MRRLFFLLIFIINPLLSRSQNIKFDLVSANTVSVLNYNKFSMRIIVYDNGSIIHDKVVPPLIKSNFLYSFYTSDVIKMNYIAVYDNKAIEYDLNRIEAERRKIKQIKARNIALIAITDLFTDGGVSDLIEFGTYGIMIYRGATVEEWAEALFDSTINYGIDKSFDKNYQRTIASSAYSLLKLLNSNEYSELQNDVRYVMKLRESNYKISGLITDTARLPRKKPVKYPNFSANVSYLFDQTFAEDNNGENSIFLSTKSEQLNNEYPFEIRLGYQKSPLLGVFAEYSQSNFFRNIDNSDFQYLEENSAFKFTSYSLGLNPTYSLFQIGIGATYLQQENFLIESNTNTLQATEVTHKFGAFIEPKIDVNLSPSLKISGSWKGIIFREKDIDDTFLQLYYFKVGIAYHISKRAWDFTN